MHSGVAINSQYKCLSGGRVQPPGSFLWLFAMYLCHFPVGFDGFLAKEGQQFGIDLVCVRPSDAVGSSFYDMQACAFDEFGTALSRCREGHNTVVVAMDHQCRNIHTSQIQSEGFMPLRYTCKASCRRRACGDVPSGLDDFLTDALAQKQIGVVEVPEELAEETYRSTVIVF